MKNKCQYWYSAVFFLLMTTQISAQDQKLNIAVLDLDPTGISLNDAQFLSDRLRTELFQTGKFQVVERSKMNEILSEQGFQQSGCTSIECAVEIGQILNVSAMVAGSVGKIEDLYSITLRLIDVESGMILQTATRDFEGKLSELLTDVIPDVTSDLASTDLAYTTSAEKITIQEEKSQINRFAIALKGGFAFLQYSSDINKSIDDLNQSVIDQFKDLPNHSNFGIEGRYSLSPDWHLKIGISLENLISDWVVNFSETALFRELTFEREYQFSNGYVGVNYTFWKISDVFNSYLGIDLGSTTFKSRLKQHLTELNGTVIDQDNTYTYNQFTWKLALGGMYYISPAFSMSLEFSAKFTPVFDTADQIPRQNDPDLSANIIYPEEIDASGLQFNLYFAYHF